MGSGGLKIFNKLSMKRVLFAAMGMLYLTSCVPYIHTDGPYRGKVVELETGNPIEGAVVAASWTIAPYVHSDRFCDAKETVTDKNGEFKLPQGWCISHIFAELYKPQVVVFKPGYLVYPPLGATQEERLSRMPDFTGKEFRDKKQYYVIKLGRPKTREERRSIYTFTGFSDDEARKKLPMLMKLLNEERRNLGFSGVEE